MKGKILLVVGLSIGYVLGARAGRERYEEIKRMADKVWNDPRVQKQVNQAEGFVKDKAPDVAEFLADGAKTVVSKVAGTKKPAPKRTTRSSSASGSSSTSGSSTTKK
jgi:hypothetical protein